MKISKKVLLILSLIGIFAGFYFYLLPVRIDATTNERFEATFKQMKNSLLPEKQVQLEEAIVPLVYTPDNFRSILLSHGAEREVKESSLLQKLHGKTADEIILLGNAVKKEILELEAIKIKEELAEKIALEQNIITLVKRIRSKLLLMSKEQDNFLIIDSKFEEKSSAIGKIPVLEFIVKNNTPFAISLVVFDCKLVTQGRTIPWLEEEFSHKIAGGLEPGESAKWQVPMNPYSSWGTTKAPTDAILEAKVNRLYGADEKVIFPVNLSPDNHLAMTKACLATQRVLSGAIAMYNMDHKIGLSSIDDQTYDLLLKENHLNSKIEYQPGCKFFANGDLVATGVVECEFHGSIFPGVFSIEKREFVNFFNDSRTAPTLQEHVSAVPHIGSSSIDVAAQQISQVISSQLASMGLGLLTSADFSADYDADEDIIALKHLDSLSAEARIKKAIVDGSKDLAIACGDFNVDNTLDVFVVAKFSGKCFLFFFDGLTQKMERVPEITWDIAFKMSFADEEKQVLVCRYSYCDVVELGFVDGLIKKVSLQIYDTESDSLECSDHYSCSLEKITEKWAYLKVVYYGKTNITIVPRKIFLSTGFVWGNRVNVRDGYGPDYKKHKVLFQLNNGNMVKILEEREGWFKITNLASGNQFCGDHKNCWIQGDFLKNLPPPRAN